MEHCVERCGGGGRLGVGRGDNKGGREGRKGLERWNEGVRIPVMTRCERKKK